MIESRPPFTYIRDLDAVRGFAILWVLIYHYYALLRKPTWLAEMLPHWDNFAKLGFLGVALFFCLSGFLIGGILLRTQNDPNYFTAFVVRRVLRLIPVLFLLLSSYHFLGERFPGPATGDIVPIWSHYFFVQNFYMTTENTFGNTWLGVTWSLSVEEQFYIMVVVLLFIFPKRLIPFILVVGCIFPILLRLGWQNNFPEHGIGRIVLTPMRFDSFSAGLFLAYLHKNHRSVLETKQATLAAYTGIICAGLLFACAVYRWLHDLEWAQSCLYFFFVNTYTFANLGFIGVLLLAIQTPKQGGKLSAFNPKSWLSSPSLQWLGRVSYFTYLAHMPILVMTSYAIRGEYIQDLNRQGALILVCSLFVTLALAQISMKFFEGPIMRWGKNTTIGSYTST